MQFRKTKFSGIDGSTRVRYTVEKKGDMPDFYIEASSTGVVFKGELVVAHGDVEEANKPFPNAELRPLAKVLGNAWTEHQMLRPKLNLQMSGHEKPKLHEV